MATVNQMEIRNKGDEQECSHLRAGRNRRKVALIRGGIVITFTVGSTFKKTIIVLFIAAVALAVVMLSGRPFASADPETPTYNVYLKLDGFTGDVITRGYEKWIALNDDVSFGLKNMSNVSAPSGIALGKPAFDGLEFTKPVDSASIALFQATATTKAIKSASLVFVKTSSASAATSKPFLQIDLTDVVLNSYTFDHGVETIDLNYLTINMTYTPLKPDGSAGTPIKGGFDLKKLAKI